MSIVLEEFRAEVKKETVCEMSAMLRQLMEEKGMDAVRRAVKDPEYFTELFRTYEETHVPSNTPTRLGTEDGETVDKVYDMDK